MTLLSFGPKRVDIEAYQGDTFLLSFNITESNNEVLSKTGSWAMIFYDKSDDSEIDSDPTGISITPIINGGFSDEEFIYTSTEGQELFSGEDDNGNPMSYVVGTISLYLNDVLTGSSQYTASTGNSVLLSASATEGDIIRIECLSAVPPTGSAEILISNELSELLGGTASVVYEFYLDDGKEKYTFINGNVSINPRIFD